MQKKERKKKEGKVRSQWVMADVIRLVQLGKKKRKRKNHSEPCSGFTSRTFSASLVGGLTDAAAMQLVTSTLPPTWCRLTHRETSEEVYKRTGSSSSSSSSSSERPVSPSHPRCWRGKWPLGLTQVRTNTKQLQRDGAHTWTDQISGGLRSELIMMTLQMEWGSSVFLLVSYLCLHSGLCARRRRAESKSAPMWRETPGQSWQAGHSVSGVTSLWWQVMLIEFKFKPNLLFFFLLFHQNSNFLVWIYHVNGFKYSNVHSNEGDAQIRFILTTL